MRRTRGAGSGPWGHLGDVCAHMQSPHILDTCVHMCTDAHTTHMILNKRTCAHHRVYMRTRAYTQAHTHARRLAFLANICPLVWEAGHHSDSRDPIRQDSGTQREFI